MKILLAILVFLTLLTVIFYIKHNSNKRGDVNSKSSTISVSDINEDVASQTITLITTGDIGLVRDINFEIQKRHDPNYPFLKIGDYLRNADLTITNLEGPLINNCPIVLTGFMFCGEDTNAKGLVYAGVDAVSIANNHSTNFGLDGLSQTSTVLKSAGIVPFGQDNNIEYLKIKGKKVALVGFVELGNNWAGLNNATPQNVTKLVSSAKTKADIVITSFHWGVEYTRKPTQNQVSLAHIAIDNGADIVLGNHAHWIQDSEIYRDRFITYAQGNTIFDQDWSQETKEGVLYKFEYQNEQFKKIDEKFTVIEQNVQPRFATPVEESRIKAKLNTSQN